MAWSFLLFLDLQNQVIDYIAFLIKYISYRISYNKMNQLKEAERKASSLVQDARKGKQALFESTMMDTDNLGMACTMLYTHWKLVSLLN